MTFTNALSIATSGLNAASARASVAANNIANADTEGYTRRTVLLEERMVGSLGAGVRVVATDNVEAQFITADRMRLASENAYTAEKSTATERITQLIGDPGVENGLFRSYARFETALKDAAATPESPVLLRQAVDAAQELSSNFNELSARADQERSSADRRISESVSSVNTALSRLEELNALAQTEITPEIADERQRLVDRINEEIPVTVQRREGGINLVTDGGAFLLTERAHFVEFSTTGNVGRTQTLGSPLSGLSVDGIDITPGGGAPQASRGGRVAALFEQRDVIVPGFQDQLDALASDVINRFSDDSVDPTKPIGEVGLFTNGASTAPPVANEIGVAARIQINAAVDPAQGGENYRLRDGLGATTEGPEGAGEQLNRLVDAFTGGRAAPAILGVAGERSATELAAEVASAISFDDRNAADAALFAASRFDIARNAELAVTGVDTDQELQQLLLIEQAYAANARVIQTVSEMIDTLLSIG
ncbi:MAG: flagellar hook-associated protein FlgK [Pseudomonadota bacterium]